MEQQMTENNLIQAFQLTRSNNNQQRKQAQQYISNASYNPQFLPTLINIMQSAQQPLQLSICTYLLKYAKELSQQDPQYTIAVIVILINSLQSQRISNKAKTILKGVISSTIMKDKYNAMYQIVVQNLIFKLEQKKNNLTLNDYQYFGNYIHICLLKKQNTSPKVIKRLYEQLLKLILSLFVHIANSQQQEQQMLLKLTALKSLLFPLSSMLDLKALFLKNKQCLSLLNDQSLNTVLSKCLNLKCRNGKLFALSSDDFDKCVSTVKGIIAKIFLNCMKVIVSGVRQPYLSMNTLYKNRQAYLNELVQSLLGLFKQREYDISQLANSMPFDELINTVSELANIPQFIDYYFPRKQLMMSSIIFPILNSNNNLQSIYQQPQEMYNSTIYLVNQGIVDQSSHNQQQQEGGFSVQVKAIKMIHYLCRHLHGVTTQLVNDCLRQLERNPKNLMMLVILNSLVQKINGREDLLGYIKQYIVKEIGNYNQALPNQQKIIYYMKLLLGYRYVQLFNKDNKQFLTQLWGLANHILSTGKDETIKFLCLEIVIITIKIGFSTLYQQRSLTINTLTSMICLSRKDTKISDTLLFRVLECIEQTFAETPDVSMMQAHVQSCVTQVVLKLQNRYETQNNQTTLIVNKCWNTIKTIIEKSLSSKTLLDSLENIILPLYPFILHPNVDQQQFMYCLGLFIKKSKAITKQYQINFFSMIPMFFKNNKLRFFDLFDIINIYINYGANLFADNKTNIEIIISMVIQQLENISEEDGICEGILILQNFIYNMHQYLSQEHWSVIIESVMTRLGKNIRNFFLASNLIVVIGLSYVSNFDALQNLQIGQKMLEQMMKISHFIESYPCKVHIVCLCNLLKKTYSNLIRTHYVRIFDFAITLTRTSHYRNQIQTEEQNILDKEFINKQHQGYHMVVERFESVMKDLDEFEVMKKTLKEIKADQPLLFANVVQQLPAEKVEFLKLVMQIQKVGNNEYRSIIKVKRS